VLCVVGCCLVGCYLGVVFNSFCLLALLLSWLVLVVQQYQPTSAPNNNKGTAAATTTRLSPSLSPPSLSLPPSLALSPNLCSGSYTSTKIGQSRTWRLASVSHALQTSKVLSLFLLSLSPSLSLTKTNARGGCGGVGFARHVDAEDPQAVPQGVPVGVWLSQPVLQPSQLFLPPYRWA